MGQAAERERSQIKQKPFGKLFAEVLKNRASPHYQTTVTEFQNHHFAGRCIGRCYPIPRRPQSPDLTSCKHFLWGYVKDTVDHTKGNDLSDLHLRITDAEASVTMEMLRNTCRETEQRLDVSHTRIYRPNNAVVNLVILFTNRLHVYHSRNKLFNFFIRCFLSGHSVYAKFQSEKQKRKRLPSRSRSECQDSVIFGDKILVYDEVKFIGLSLSGWKKEAGPCEHVFITGRIFLDQVSYYQILKNVAAAYWELVT